MTPAQQRKAQRGVHLVAALMLVAYVYAPGATHLQDAVRFVGIPVLAVSGMAMWQAARIRRLRRAAAEERRAAQSSPVHRDH